MIIKLLRTAVFGDPLPDNGLAEEAVESYIRSTEYDTGDDFWIAKGDLHNFCVWRELDTDPLTVYVNAYAVELDTDNTEHVAYYVFDVR